MPIIPDDELKTALDDGSDPILSIMYHSANGQSSGQGVQTAFSYVARAVSRNDIMSNPKASEACHKEWDRLKSIGTWDDDQARSWIDVKKEADREGREIHIGAVNELCFEKGSDLEADNPERKYKGRVVFLGNDVRNQSGNVAVFEELSSSPASLEASKLCDFYGLLSRPSVAQTVTKGGAVGPAGKAARER